MALSIVEMGEQILAAERAKAVTEAETAAEETAESTGDGLLALLNTVLQRLAVLEEGQAMIKMAIECPRIRTPVRDEHGDIQYVVDQMHPSDAPMNMEM